MIWTLTYFVIAGVKKKKRTTRVVKKKIKMSLLLYQKRANRIIHRTSIPFLPYWTSSHREKKKSHLAESKDPLLWSDDAALDHQEVVLHFTVVREASLLKKKRSNKWLTEIFKRQNTCWNQGQILCCGTVKCSSFVIQGCIGKIFVLIVLLYGVLTAHCK